MQHIGSDPHIVLPHGTEHLSDLHIPRISGATNCKQLCYLDPGITNDPDNLPDLIQLSMARTKSRTCGFCHKRGHIEKNCWKKTPALKSSTASCQATTNKGSPNDTSCESTQSSEHLNFLTTRSHGPIQGSTSAAGEQEQPCLLLKLPNELLVEIAAFLCAPDEAGHVCFQAIKSFSLVSKRVRSVTIEQLPLTFSSQSLQFRQLIASKGYLSQVK